MEQILSNQQIGMKLLYTIQVLYQNGEITPEKKNLMAKQIKEAIHDGNFDNCIESFELLKMGSLFKGLLNNNIIMMEEKTC